MGVVGIGGLGHLGLQFARAFGCEVTAFSTSKDKEAEARELGAHNFVNTRENGRAEEGGGESGLDSFDGVGGPGLSELYCDAAAEGNAGGAGGVAFADADFGVQPDWRAEGVAGSPSGSPRDLHEMLDVAARHKVKAITERFAMKDANKAVEKVKKNQVRYRAVLAN